MKPSMCSIKGCSCLAVGNLRGVPLCQMHGIDIGSKIKMMRDVMGGKSPADYVVGGKAKLPIARVEEVLDDGSTHALKRVP